MISWDLRKIYPMDELCIEKSNKELEPISPQHMGKLVKVISTI
jgi:hypothetical protein